MGLNWNKLKSLGKILNGGNLNIQNEKKYIQKKYYSNFILFILGKE